MKKLLILITAATFAVQISNAQTQKGAQTLGGYLSLNHSLTSNGAVNSYTGTLTSQANKNTSFSIGPAYSHFIADKVELGGTLSYSTGNYSNDYADGSVMTTSKQTSNAFGGAIYLRKYCLYDNKFGIRTGPYVSYFRGNDKYTSSNTQVANASSKSNNYNVGGTVDLVYYPSNKLGFAATLASLAYSNYKSSSTSGPFASAKVENLGLNFINSNLALSVFYVFGSK